MGPKAFSFTAGVVFLAISLGHLLRVVLGVTLMVAGIAVPMWASVLAVIFMGYLAFEGLRLGRRFPSAA